MTGEKQKIKGWKGAQEVRTQPCAHSGLSSEVSPCCSGLCPAWKPLRIETVQSSWAACDSSWLFLCVFYLSIQAEPPLSVYARYLSPSCPVQLWRVSLCLLWHSSHRELLLGPPKPSLLWTKQGQLLQLLSISTTNWTSPAPLASFLPSSSPGCCWLTLCIAGSWPACCPYP